MVLYILVKAVIVNLPFESSYIRKVDDQIRNQDYETADYGQRLATFKDRCKHLEYCAEN